MFGLHRFYTGRAQSAVWMCLTLGGCGIWYLYDVVVLAAGDFRDGDGRRVVRWEVGEGEGGTARLPRSVEDLEERLQGLETQVSELAERLEPRWCRPPRTCSGRATSSSRCSRRRPRRSGCAARGRRSWRCSSRPPRATPSPRSRPAR